jgi:hypothetical protein
VLSIWIGGIASYMQFLWLPNLGGVKYSAGGSISIQNEYKMEIKYN